MSDDLNTALEYHKRGLLSQAARIYADLLATHPGHAGLLHLLGVVALQQGDPRRAVELIGQAVAREPSEAPFHANLAEAYRTLGEIDQAVACCRTALRLQPDFPEALNTLALALQAQGKTEAAIEQFRAALRIKPDFAMALNNLGNALLRQGDREAALAHFRQAVQADPNLVEALSNLGQLLLEMEKPEEALPHCLQAVRLRPQFPEAQNNLGNVLREMGRLAEAKECYVQALRLNPNLAMSYNNMGQAIQEEGSLDDAMPWYQRAIQLDPQSARIQSNLASALEEAGGTDEAIAHYQAALAADPRYAEAHSGLACVYHEQGRLEEAQRSFRTAAALDPRHAGALAQLATMLSGKLPEADLEALRRLLAYADLSATKRATLLFALAQVLDARGAYDEAAEHLRQANALALAEKRKRGQGYDPADHERFVSGIIAACTPAFFRRAEGLGLATERPVFIVGLPRSATTLTEQILAAHPRVFGAGELRLGREDFLSLAHDGEAAAPRERQALEALERLDRQTIHRIGQRHLERLRQLNDWADRVVDKMPDNYLFLGLLAAVFPRAKFLHCRRDLRDVAVSCWMTNFRQIRWANDPRHIASRFAQYRRLMEHWRQVLPLAMLEVSYEETVADLEGAARRLVAWCGLEWDPACLAFYEGKRLVRTASITQVRQPIYTRSVARWKHYQQALGPLLEELGSGQECG
jgi:tetratricopeptide (TPR) repeat protein